MSNNAVEVSKSFADKMKDRVRDSIGDLISDSDLAKIVEEGLQMAFFKPYKDADNYGRIIEKPPLVKEMVIDLMRERIAMNIDKWFVDHEDDVKCILDDILRDGIANIVFQSFEANTQHSLFALRNSLMNDIKNSIIR